MITLELLDKIYEDCLQLEKWYTYKLVTGYNYVTKGNPITRWIIELSVDVTVYRIIYSPLFRSITIHVQSYNNKIKPVNTILSQSGTIDSHIVTSKKNEHVIKLKDILYRLEDTSQSMIDPELWNDLDET